MIRIVGTCAALALIIVLAFPFARDAYHRYDVARRLDPQDRAAFQNWSGDPASFMRSLYERCELINGRNAPACDSHK
ncbi:MAG TPA: hypothetical protein VN808_03365 [Stellaceae bacterium]|nr:hypothetical protein [Stellaceae bacterium]